MMTERDWNIKTIFLHKKCIFKITVDC